MKRYSENTIYEPRNECLRLAAVRDEARNRLLTACRRSQPDRHLNLGLRVSGTVKQEIFVV